MSGYEFDLETFYVAAFWFMVVREFFNNMLLNVPSLKSNKSFELVCNVMDSIIMTAKGRVKGDKHETDTVIDSGKPL